MGWMEEFNLAFWSIIFLANTSAFVVNLKSLHVNIAEGDWIYYPRGIISRILDTVCGAICSLLVSVHLHFILGVIFFIMVVINLSIDLFTKYKVNKEGAVTVEEDDFK